MRRLSICLAALLAVLGAMPAMPVQARPTRAALVHVASYDNYYVPSSPVVARGATVSFDFDGAHVHHTVTDDSGMGLFDSGDVAGGGPSYTYAFTAAGTYPFYCVFHPEMRGRIRVPMRAVPTHAPKGSTFTLTWASVDAPAGYRYDVQMRHPGGTWAMWRGGVTTRTATLAPHARGTFRFRARLRDATTGATSDWSDTVRLEVV